MTEAIVMERSQPASLRQLLGIRFWLTAALAAIAVAILSAIPTDIIDNPWFTRMTPVYTDQYFFWISTSLLVGVLLATYLTGSGIRGSAGGAGGSILGYLAIGCPICNKLIVALLGISGALNVFAPLQPVLGALGLLLVAGALAYRLRDLRRGSCSVAT